MRQPHFPAWFLQRWPEERLDRMRASGDPLADETIAAILASGDRDKVNAVMRRLHRPDEWPADTPPELQHYLDASEVLPPWANHAALDRAWRFMETHGVRYNMVLLFLSLPVLYAWARGGAQTLAMTGQLTDYFARRLSETMRFVRAVIAEQGLGPQGTGIRTTQKVRLMHATIRHFATGAHKAGQPPFWKADEWGVPINQEALVATMLAFSTVATDGLRKLDVPVTEQEDTDLLHLWKVVGAVLGIDPANMPETPAEARLLWRRCEDRNFGRTDAGLLLTARHMAFMQQLAGQDKVLADALTGMNAAMLRYLMGHRIAVKYLGVPKPGWWGALLLAVRGLFGLSEVIVDNVDPVDRWLDQHAAKLLEALQRVWDGLDGSRPFAIPSEAEAEQGLKDFKA